MTEENPLLKKQDKENEIAQAQPVEEKKDGPKVTIDQMKTDLLQQYKNMGTISMV